MVRGVDDFGWALFSLDQRLSGLSAEIEWWVTQEASLGMAMITNASVYFATSHNLDDIVYAAIDSRVAGRPTTADKQFAACWSSIPPELSARMKFFVVRRGRVVEYGLADGGTLRWKI